MPVQPSQDVTQAILPLTDIFSKQADDLLDLRHCALTRTHPGRCVLCYYRLYEQKPLEVGSRLDGLRQWIETNIEIAARDEANTLLETLPLNLTAEKLDALCFQFINEFRENRAYTQSEICLEFRYKQQAWAA